METKEKNRQQQKGNKEQNAYNPATDRRVVYTRKTHYPSQQMTKPNRQITKPTNDKAKQTDDKTNPADDKAKQTDYKNQTDI